MTTYDTIEEIDDYLAGDPEELECELTVQTSQGEKTFSQIGAAGRMIETDREATSVLVSDPDDTFSIVSRRIDEVTFRAEGGAGELTLVFNGWTNGEEEE